MLPIDTSTVTVLRDDFFRRNGKTSLRRYCTIMLSSNNNEMNIIDDTDKI